MESKALFRVLDSRYYRHEMPVLSLGYYDPGSHGEDDFSRKQVWFYTYGDEELKQEFRGMLLDLFTDRFDEDVMDWNLITLYPTHVEGQVNPNMRDLLFDLSADVDTEFEQVLRRTETVTESHELENEKAKVVNLEGSIEVTRDLEGQNVVLVDNIVLTGTSLLHGYKHLKQRGAENVFGLSLGTSTRERDQTEEVENGVKASDLLERTGPGEPG